MPMLIGMLPMVGGAMFSAPMVDEASRHLDVNRENRTFLNYWFRHAMEPIFPLYPSLIVAAGLMNVPVQRLTIAQWPLCLAALAGGVLFGLAGTRQVEPAAADRAGRRETVVLLLKSVWPILLVLGLSVVLQVDLILSLAVTIALLVLVERLGPRRLWETARRTPLGIALHDVAQRIEQGAARGDAILHLQPFKTQEFANSYRGRLPVYGFFDRDALPTDEQAWMERIRETNTRLWVVPDYRPPDESAWERQLRTDDYLLVDDRVSGPSNQRVALYALAPAQQLSEAGLGTVFGDPTGATPVTEENGWFRLNGYAFTSETTHGGSILLTLLWDCPLYTSDAADDPPCVDLGGRPIIKKKNQRTHPHHTVLVSPF